MTVLLDLRAAVVAQGHVGVFVGIHVEVLFALVLVAERNEMIFSQPVIGPRLERVCASVEPPVVAERGIEKAAPARPVTERAVCVDTVVADPVGTRRAQLVLQHQCPGEKRAGKVIIRIVKALDERRPPRVERLLVLEPAQLVFQEPDGGHRPAGGVIRDHRFIKGWTLVERQEGVTRKGAAAE